MSGGEFFIGNVSTDGVKSSLPSLSTAFTLKLKTSKSDLMGT